MTNNLKQLSITAIEAAIEAGKEIIKIYNQDFDIEFKKDHSPLTTADKNANDIINSFLLKTDIPIISEENKQAAYSVRKKWKLFWMVDPLDGTKEFIKRNGEFTVNIALIQDQKPILGVIYVPVIKELFFADVFEKKAFKYIVQTDLNIDSLNLFDSDKTKTFDSIQILKPLKKLSQRIRVVGSRSHMNTETTDFIKTLKKQYKKVEIVSKGSSLKFCLLAEGKADIYPRFAPTMEWDTAAGHAICNAVGIQIIDINTQKELLYNKENLLNPSFIGKF